LLVRSTAYVVQSKCGDAVFLCYRGTDPFDLSTWAADYDVNPPQVPVPESNTTPAGAFVHGGFYRNQRATWFDVAAALSHAIRGESIVDWLPLDQELGKTGESPRPLRALYITGHSLGAAMAAITAFRIARDQDYAERLLPSITLDLLFERHPGEPRSKLGQLVSRLPFGQALRETLSAQLRALHDRNKLFSFYDHSPTYYIACSQPPEVISEFGDF
jgi:hypothetical protein